MGNLAAARSLLSRLRTQSIDKAWRTIMEGGLLEARAGNITVARKISEFLFLFFFFLMSFHIFKYLIKNVPWYGPIYQEAYRFEEKCEEYERAIAIVEKGLKENPRYGPLWFSALRIQNTTCNICITFDCGKASMKRQAGVNCRIHAPLLNELAYQSPKSCCGKSILRLHR